MNQLRNSWFNIVSLGGSCTSELELAVADPGFSWGGPNPKVGVLTYFFGRKLHENERILAPGGVPGVPP